MTRARPLALGLLLTVVTPFAAICGESAVGGHLAMADEAIDVGTELMATSDVTLHRAEIAKGSRVSVTKVTRAGGQLDTLNVALADGHVVQVTMTQVHTYFRVVDE